nr:hypothetical protein NG677_03940 [Methylobacterium sp. OTU13CASTA1]
MSQTEIDDYTGRERQIPETIVERIAWALCARHSQAFEGYLQDDELEGLEALIAAMERRCGTAKAEAQFLGVPVGAHRRYIEKIKRLARTERQRRADPRDPLVTMHLTAAYWQDYMPEAQAAFSVAIEDARVAANLPASPDLA